MNEYINIGRYEQFICMRCKLEFDVYIYRNACSGLCLECLMYLKIKKNMGERKMKTNKNVGNQNNT